MGINTAPNPGVLREKQSINTNISLFASSKYTQDYGASVGAETSSIIDQKNREKEDMIMSVGVILTEAALSLLIGIKY